MIRVAQGDPYIVSYKDGIEVERINPRFVISVEWEIPEPTTTEEEA